MFCRTVGQASFQTAATIGPSTIDRSNAARRRAPEGTAVLAPGATGVTVAVEATEDSFFTAGAIIAGLLVQGSWFRVPGSKVPGSGSGFQPSLMTRPKVAAPAQRRRRAGSAFAHDLREAGSRY